LMQIIHHKDTEITKTFNQPSTMRLIIHQRIAMLEKICSPQRHKVHEDFLINQAQCA
jgi:hypothetical protein